MPPLVVEVVVDPLMPQTELTKRLEDWREMLPFKKFILIPLNTEDFMVGGQNAIKELLKLGNGNRMMLIQFVMNKRHRQV